MEPDKIYRELQKHLDRQPIGFPATKSGVELKILARLFTPRQAQVALYMSHQHESADSLAKRVPPSVIEQSELASELRDMSSQGAVFYKVNSEGLHEYALVALVVGMYEFQVSRLDKEFLADIKQYFTEKFGLEYLSTKHPQFRIIPIDKSISPSNQIATYEDMERNIKDTADAIAILPCICRKAKNLHGKTCKKGDRLEVCMTFRDVARYVIDEGFGREISKDEALKISRESVAEGLVLQASGETETQVICACCACCCGILSLIGSVKRPVDFVSSNFYAAVESQKCTGCGLCVKKCQIAAISVDKKSRQALVNLDRCIGCGVCVPSCKMAALTLVDKPNKTLPPKTTEVMLDENLKNKKGLMGKGLTAVKIIMGLPVK